MTELLTVAKPVNLGKYFLLEGKKSTRTVQSFKTLFLSVALMTMAGCASKPTVNGQSSRLTVVPQYYTVKSGDTLSKIAARYNLDYREIASLNNIDSSYTIYTNQSLRLHNGGKNTPRIQVKTAASPSPNAFNTQKIPAQTRTREVTQAPSAVSAPVTIKATPITNSTSTPVQKTTNASVPSATIATSNILWQWPSDNAVLQQFDPAKDIKGVRISGREGDPVRAAADGDVVYASNRLVEYGNLVLVRHLNGYVTAYAHNSKILVIENDKVKAGQKIAEMGSSGANQVMLEFQIRLNGKPVNPTGLLPKK